MCSYTEEYMEDIVRHIGFACFWKSRALLMANLTGNPLQSLRTRRRICPVRVKKQFTRTFALIEGLGNVLLFAPHVPSDYTERRGKR